VAPSWITPSSWKIEKKSYFYNVFFMNWCFQIQSFKWFRWKFTELWNNRVWRPSWISFIFFLWSKLLKYVIRSPLNLIAYEMTIALPQSSLAVQKTPFSKAMKTIIHLKKNELFAPFLHRIEAKYTHLVSRNITSLKYHGSVVLQSI
jgi:hypothetical protein